MAAYENDEPRRPKFFKALAACIGIAALATGALAAAGLLMLALAAQAQTFPPEGLGSASSVAVDPSLQFQISQALSARLPKAYSIHVRKTLGRISDLRLAQAQVCSSVAGAQEVCENVANRLFHCFSDRCASGDARCLNSAKEFYTKQLQACPTQAQDVQTWCNPTWPGNLLASFSCQGY